MTTRTTINLPNWSFHVETTMMHKQVLLLLLTIPAIAATRTAWSQDEAGTQGAASKQELRQRFGEQQFSPPGGFLLRQGQQLPALIWEQPDLVAQVVTDITTPTRWFNDRLEAVTVAERPGRYYAYGEAPVPDCPVLKRAMTCCCLSDDQDLACLAAKWLHPDPTSPDEKAIRKAIGELTLRWQSTEDGVVELPTWCATTICFCLSFGLFAANRTANDLVVLWDETQPMLDSANTPTLNAVRFSRIKQREPDVDGFNWLHGVAIVRHKRTLFTSWGHNQGKENTLTEIAQGRRSRNDARTWDPVELISAGSEKHGVSHGSFLSHDGALWAFCGRFTGFRQNTAMEAFVLDETANRWKSRGIVAGDGFWPMRSCSAKSG